MRRSALTLGLLAATAVAAGCSADVDVGSSVDEEKAAEQIARDYARQVPSAKVAETTCDDDIEAEVGATGTCRMRLENDVRIEFAVRVTSAEDDGRIRWSVKDASVPGSALAPVALKLLEERVGQEAVGLTCPGRRPVKAGETFRCTLQADEDTRYGATLTILNEQLGVDIEVDEEPTGS